MEVFQSQTNHFSWVYIGCLINSSSTGQLIERQPGFRNWTTTFFHFLDILLENCFQGASLRRKMFSATCSVCQCQKFHRVMETVPARYECFPIFHWYLFMSFTICKIEWANESCVPPRIHEFTTKSKRTFQALMNYSMTFESVFESIDETQILN